MKLLLEELASRYAILPAYEMADGGKHRPPEKTLRLLLGALGVAAETPEQQAASLATAPPTPARRLRAPKRQSCYLPQWLTNGSCWGIAIQLYALRSSRNWGIGDFTDLADFVRTGGAAGADFVGVNPLHALFLADPLRCSPFSPSNRRFLNPIYIDVEAVRGFSTDDHDAAALEAARRSEFVDYPAVSRLKLSALRAIWLRSGHDQGALASFAAKGGEPLRRHAIFEAISARMTAEGHGAGWHGWPSNWQNAESATVADFAGSHFDDVAFFIWLQWIAAQQLRVARKAAFDAGMRIGLYLDFAVGEAPDGSSSWSHPDMILRGVRVGAPPDYFNAAGQDWGLAPLSPLGITDTRAALFRTLIDAAAHGAGALRIDHAMGLWQLFLIPDGCRPAEGTYVRFPIADMIRALAGASHANSTIMIGEDLGNVPEGFRSVMDAANILSCRVLYFERDENGYVGPSAYPRKALACLSTHDLPTFAGWWQGDDIELRGRFGLIPADAAAEQSVTRAVERDELLADLMHAGLLPKTFARTEVWPALVVAVHRHLARAPSRLLAARVEDLVGQREPVNLPSTTAEYPNWQRKLPVPIEQLAAHPLFTEIAAVLRAERPRDGT